MNWKLASAILAALLVAETGWVIKGFIDDAKDDPVETLTTDPVETPVEAEDQLELARRFRPVLRFDSAEAWRPLEIDRFLEESHARGRYVHRFCDRAQNPPGCDRLGGLSQLQSRIRNLAQHGVNHYLDVAGEQANGHDFATPDAECGATPPLLDCNRGPRTAIYYNVRRANGRFYVDYWWFFRYNDFPEFEAAQRCESSFRPACGDHEGDWEGVTVVTAPEDPDGVGYVAYAAHSGSNRYAASQLQLEGPEQTRPVVHVADGSHAAYPDTCVGGLPVIGCQQLAAKVARGLPEGRHDGVRPWGRNKGAACDDNPDQRGNTECLQPLPPASDEELWNAFAGLWGRVCAGGRECPVVKGPRSPGRQPRYREPWCAHVVDADGRTVTEGRTCDVLTPGADAAADPGVATAADCDAWGGASVAVLACDRGTLADALASQEEQEESISIRIGGEDVGATATRGVAQFVGKALRARANVVIQGRVTDVLIRARHPEGQRPKDLVEARFAGVELEAGQEAIARIRYRGGEVKVTLLLPSGAALLPTDPPTRPIEP